MASVHQKPLGSGFGMRSEPSDILAGVDLSGKTCIVTGGYSGLGLETSKALSGAGAQIVVPARRPEAAEDALVGVANTEIAVMDLGDLASAKAFGDSFVASGRPLDILINNAAVMACPETRSGPDNWEAQFATNHYGHFAMVCALEPALKAAGAKGGARVVSLSSTGHHLSPIRHGDLHFNTGYDKWLAYGQAKTANSLFAVELDRRGEADGIRAFAVHPGGIMTPLQRHLPKEEMIAFGWMDGEGNVNPMFKSPTQGASTSLWAATSPQLDGIGGVYCEDCDIAQLDSEGTARYNQVKPYAVDSEEAKKLWALSVDATRADGFG
ncbi:MAG: SDR family NAD(P)-dependent oxidoreductase [Pseudomonadota bacterium]